MRLKDYYNQDIDLTNPREITHNQQEANMPNIDDVYQNSSNALKAEDLKGHEVKCLINGAELKQFDNGNKIVLSFQGKEKTLVLNKTNARRIAEQFGNNTDNWSGSEIILYPDKTEFQGKMVDCIRVRPSLPKADFDDDIPF